MEDEGPRITAVRSAADVEVGEVASVSGNAETRTLDDITTTTAFEAHAGWIGHVEHAGVTATGRAARKNAGSDR